MAFTVGMSSITLTFKPPTDLGKAGVSAGVCLDFGSWVTHQRGYFRFG
jgi:hypothetical protein